MKSIFFFLLLFSYMSSLSQNSGKDLAYTNRDKYMFAVRTKEKKFSKTIPFQYIEHLIIIPVQIKEKSCRFIFDTGAISAISQQLNLELNLSSSFSNEMIDGSGIKNQQKFYLLDKIRLENIDFMNVGVGIFDFFQISKGIRLQIDGIIGSNLIRILNWKIDYQNQLITMSDKKIKSSVKSDSFDFKENFSGSPMLSGFLGEFSYDLEIDTGNNLAFNIPDSLYFKSYKSKNHNLKVLEKTKFVSLFSNDTNRIENRTFSADIDSIYIDRRLFKNQEIRVNPSPLPMVGNKFFEQFGEFVIDYARKRIYLPKNPQ